MDRGRARSFSSPTHVSHGCRRPSVRRAAHSRGMSRCTPLDRQALLHQLPLRACHNCRRRRLRCDRSLPTCSKCHSQGVRCLGYGQLLRWTTNLGAYVPRPASRHHVQPLAHETEDRDLVRDSHPTVAWDHVQSPCFSLIDPVLQHLDGRSRFYISHCKSLGRSSPCA